jgi:3-hydroxybutyryl-CoA dehydrogenase
MNVKTIAVIGANTIGRSIAYMAALSGYQTILEDVSDVRLQKAAAWITDNLESSIALRTIEGTSGGAALPNLSTAHTVEDAIRGADLIIETLPDEMEMQIELFTILDKFAKPNAIFATTGLISITELAEITFCADRCIGMRFPDSVVETKTVELVKGRETSNETVAACSDVARRMGREAVVVDDAGADRSGEPERKLANAQD